MQGIQHGEETLARNGEYAVAALLDQAINKQAATGFAGLFVHAINLALTGRTGNDASRVMGGLVNVPMQEGYQIAC